MAKNKIDVVFDIRDFLVDVLEKEHVSVLTEDSDDVVADLNIIYHVEDIVIAAWLIKNGNDRERMLKTVAQLFEGEPGYKEDWRP